jgi:acetate---CoA ligase (ADP-forming)
MAGTGVPVLRGLRAGIVALHNLATAGRRRSLPIVTGPTDEMSRRGNDADALAAEIELAAPGPLPPRLCARILSAYGIPMVRSAIVRSADEAQTAAAEIGFPLVVKIVSPDLPHRSDVGGVESGVHDGGALRQAIDRMLNAVREARPDARIDGFELQEYLFDHVEAMAGFIAAPPFGALAAVGTGGTMVELDADRAVGLCPFQPSEAAAMIERTRLGTRLAGYRNLMPRTDVTALTNLLCRLSDLAFDLAGCIRECDLNPVLIRKRSGEVRVVDMLMTKPADTRP